MGKIQCVSANRNSHNWEYIEKALRNANSPLEKKIQAEYFNLKSSLNQEGKDFALRKKNITQKNKRKLTTIISNRKKIERFVKWFKMSYSELFTQSDNLGVINKEIDINKRNNKYNNIPNNIKKIKTSNPLNKINDSNMVFDFSDIDKSHNSLKFPNEVVDKYFTINNGISSIEYLENDLARDNESVSEKSLNVNIQNQNNNLRCCNLHDRNELVVTLIETNILKFYTNHKSRYMERVFKGPPESFRWLGWLVCGEIPIERKNEFFLQNYYEKLDEKTDNQIKKDLNRTMVEISLTKFTSSQSIDKMLNEDPTSNFLYRVLRAFSNNDKEVSYCQGMNFIAGFILVASDFNETESFYMMIALFSETFGSKFGIRGFFSENFPLLKAYIFVFNYFFQKKMPDLKEHFERLEIPDEVWISKWIQTLYTICLPIDFTMRVWDCMMSHGLEFLISFSIALVKQFESELLKMSDSFDVIEFFRNIFTSKDPNTFKENTDSNLNKSNQNNNRLNLNYTPTKENEANSQCINLEEILNNAKNLKINKQTVTLIKKEYETKFHVDLSYLYKKYDMSIALGGNSAVSNSESNSVSLSVKASDSVKNSKYTNGSRNLLKSNLPANVNTQLMNEKSTGVTIVSQTNIAFAKENSENINNNIEPLHIQSLNEEEYDCIDCDGSLNYLSEPNVQIKIESHCFKAKSSIK